MEKMSLKAARVTAGLTQAQLANAIHVSKNYVIDWEKGRKNPTEEQFRKYCEACGCPTSAVKCKVLILAEV